MWQDKLLFVSADEWRNVCVYYALIVFEQEAQWPRSFSSGCFGKQSGI